MLGWTQVLPYAQLRLSSCYSINRDPDLKKVIMDSTQRLNEVTSVELWGSVEGGRKPEDVLEMSMRCVVSGVSLVLGAP